MYTYWNLVLYFNDLSHSLSAQRYIFFRIKNIGGKALRKRSFLADGSEKGWMWSDPSPQMSGEKKGFFTMRETPGIYRKITATKKSGNVAGNVRGSVGCLYQSILDFPFYFAPPVLPKVHGLQVLQDPLLLCSLYCLQAQARNQRWLSSSYFRFGEEVHFPQGRRVFLHQRPVSCSSEDGN